jgi:hypothetical protein
MYWNQTSNQLSNHTLQRFLHPTSPFSTHVSPIPIVVSLFQALTCSDNELPLLFQLPTWVPPTFLVRYLQISLIILAEITSDNRGMKRNLTSIVALTTPFVNRPFLANI